MFDYRITATNAVKNYGKECYQQALADVYNKVWEEMKSAKKSEQAVLNNILIFITEMVDKSNI